MQKKISLFLFVSVFFINSNFVFASPSINEFMYDLDGGDIDWIEIYNTGEDVDVSTLKLLVSNSTSNHEISFYSGSSVLHSGEYGIIVPTSQVGAFTSKWGNSFNIFTSSFSLPNASGVIEINNGDKNSPLDSVSYDSNKGGAGDGNSLQLISNSWTAGAPTVGQMNKQNNGSGENNSENLNNNSENTNTNNSTSNENNTDNSTVKKTKNTSKIKAEITTNTFAYVGVPVNFQGKVIGTDGEQLFHGKYFWNFGDGDFREINIVDTDKFTHTYFYPGEYTVLFEYYKDAFTDEPELSQKIIIKVVKGGVVISRVGDKEDFFIELSNKNTYDMDISKWILKSDFKSFTIPKNTILEPNKKIIISSKLTGFSIADKDTLKLTTPQLEVVSDYNFPTTQTVVSSKNIRSFSKKNYEKIEDELSINDTKIDLTANAFSSNFLKDKNYLPFVGFFGLILVSGGTVYFIRKRKNNHISNEDFDILE
jgi:hypothetical protein